MEGTSPEQRGQEGRREWLWSSIFRVRTPGSVGAGGGNPWATDGERTLWDRTLIHGNTAWAVRGQEVITEEQDEGFRFCSGILNSIPCIAGSCWGMAVIGETS